MGKQKLLYGLMGIVAVLGLFWEKVDFNKLGREMAGVLGVKTRQIELIAVGDVMLGRSVNTAMLRRGDWQYPFRRVAERLKQADVTVGNLESPLLAGCRPTDGGMIFCGNAEAVEGLLAAGFDVMGLANNHIFNYGQEGLRQTGEILEKKEILGVKEGEIKIKEVRGLRFSWLAFDDVGGRAAIEEAEKLVKKAKEKSDIVVVMMHWGEEYRREPSARQKSWGKSLIEAGAKLVIGHHPHWVQKVEAYQEGYIFYSLGNFVFDQMWSEETRSGVAAVIKIDEEQKIEYELIPVKIYDYSQPRWVRSEEK